MKPKVVLPKLASMNHHHNSKMLKENIIKSVPPCFNMRIDSIRKAQNKLGIVFCCHPKMDFYKFKLNAHKSSLTIYSTSPTCICL